MPTSLPANPPPKGDVNAIFLSFVILLPIWFIVWLILAGVGNNYVPRQIEIGVEPRHANYLGRRSLVGWALVGFVLGLVAVILGGTTDRTGSGIDSHEFSEEQYQTVVGLGVVTMIVSVFVLADLENTFGIFKTDERLRDFYGRERRARANKELAAEKRRLQKIEDERNALRRDRRVPAERIKAFNAGLASARKRLSGAAQSARRNLAKAEEGAKTSVRRAEGAYQMSARERNMAELHDVLGRKAL